MTAADAERWDARYDGQPLADPTRPDALTDELLDSVPSSGRALDVACGAGGQSLWMAERGLDVVALDVSGAAVGLTTRSRDAAGLTTRIEVRAADLDDGLPADIGAFDVIVCQRFRATHLFDAFVDRLRPGGIAVVTVLSQTGADDPGPFHAPSGELRDAFTRGDAEMLRHTEGAGQESVVVRRLA